MRGAEQARLVRVVADQLEVDRRSSSALSISSARGRSPARRPGLPRKPPPMTRHSVSRQVLGLQEPADDLGELLRELLHGALHHAGGLRRRPRASSASSFFLQISSVGLSPSGSSPSSRKRLAPLVEHLPECALAGLVADEAVLVLDLGALWLPDFRASARPPQWPRGSSSSPAPSSLSPSRGYLSPSAAVEAAASRRPRRLQLAEHRDRPRQFHQRPTTGREPACAAGQVHCLALTLPGPILTVRRSGVRAEARISRWKSFSSVLIGLAVALWLAGRSGWRFPRLEWPQAADPAQPAAAGPAAQPRQCLALRPQPRQPRSRRGCMRWRPCSPRSPPTTPIRASSRTSRSSWRPSGCSRRRASRSTRCCSTRWAPTGRWPASALAALKQRADGGQVVDEIVAPLRQALSLADALRARVLRAPCEPRPPVGAPVVGAKDWWGDNAVIPMLFRDYFAAARAPGRRAAVRRRRAAGYASPPATDQGLPGARHAPATRRR